MVHVNPETADAYRDAWEAWQKQVAALHRVFLAGEPMGAPQLKGLLNRESRAKARYDAARREMLGIPATGAGVGAGVGESAEFTPPPGPPPGLDT